MTQLLEELADLEHEQWMHWSQYVTENHDIPEELHEKWEQNWRPYEELSEELKEKDRKWARKVHDKVLDRVHSLMEQRIEEYEDKGSHVYRHEITALQGVIDDLEILKENKDSLTESEGDSDRMD